MPLCFHQRCMSTPLTRTRDHEKAAEEAEAKRQKDAETREKARKERLAKANDDPDNPVNEAGVPIRRETASGHNVQVPNYALPAPRTIPNPVITPAVAAAVNGVRPEFQDPTANIRSQLPVLHDEDQALKAVAPMDPLDEEYLNDLESLNAKYRDRREKLNAEAAEKAAKAEEKAEKEAEKANKEASEATEKALKAEQELLLGRPRTVVFQQPKKD